ncbi:hypothetical protein [Anaeroarcus burkinensis]|uniref:hypothetical protein n=1 Tax=Anaeroarcus burkinensis TaxID=82376 RepID=UPI0004853366|nr:hypothetical protein [Anaeroarcus burkinensis]
MANKQPVEKSKFVKVKVEEVAELLEISVSHAYKVMKKLNNKLEAKGHIVTTGRLSREYFEEWM